MDAGDRPRSITAPWTTQLEIGPVIAGPRYGVLFCVCASLMLAAFTLTLMPDRFRRSPSASAVGAVGCLVLIGVTACQIIVSLSFRHASALTHDVFRFGLSPVLASMSCLAGIALWLLHRVATRGQSAGTVRKTVNLLPMPTWADKDQPGRPVIGEKVPTTSTTAADPRVRADGLWRPLGLGLGGDLQQGKGDVVGGAGLDRCLP
jgi:hypothetical protein